MGPCRRGGSRARARTGEKTRSERAEFARLAKLGELLRNDGQVGKNGEGQRILPHSWIAFMRTSAPADPGYGGHLWLNKARAAGYDQAMWPGEGPADIFAMLGHQGQYVVVSPSRRLTIVRLGRSSKTEIPNVRNAIRDLANAL